MRKFGCSTVGLTVVLHAPSVSVNGVEVLNIKSILINFTSKKLFDRSHSVRKLIYTNELKVENLVAPHDFMLDWAFYYFFSKNSCQWSAHSHEARTQEREQHRLGGSDARDHDCQPLRHRDPAGRRLLGVFCAGYEVLWLVPLLHRCLKESVSSRARRT